jgi:hypothetical protein
MKNLLIAGALAIAFSFPVAAQECWTTEQFTKDVSAEFPDFVVYGGAAYEGGNGDLIIIYRANNAVWLMGFREGCVVAGPMLMDKIAPAPEPQSSPALKSPKAEVQS